MHRAIKGLVWLMGFKQCKGMQVRSATPPFVKIPLLSLPQLLITIDSVGKEGVYQRGE